MRYAIIAILVYLAAALQTALIDVVRIGRIAPLLPAVIAVAVVLLLRKDTALAIVAAIGLLEDALGAGRMGIGMAWYLILGWAVLEGSERFDLTTIQRRIALTGLFAGALAVAVGATRTSIGEPVVDIPAIVAGAAGIAIYTAAVAVPFWMVVGWCETAWLRRCARYEFY